MEFWGRCQYFHINISSNEIGRLYPHTPDPLNQAAIKMYTEEEIKNNNLTVRILLKIDNSELNPSLASRTCCECCYCDGHPRNY